MRNLMKLFPLISLAALFTTAPSAQSATVVNARPWGLLYSVDRLAGTLLQHSNTGPGPR
jgi:hypothetical protein